MSINNSGVSKAPEVGAGHYPYAEILSLNEVIHEALKSVGAHKPLVRCESLPKIEANRQQLLQVFSKMISLIISKGEKQFLYISCEELNKEVDAELLGGHKRYLIQFNTNTVTNQSWHSRHDEALISIEAQFKALGAQFQFKEVQSSGCIFTISLLGKI